MGKTSYYSLIIAALIFCVNVSFCDNDRDGQGTLIFAHVVSRTVYINIVDFRFYVMCNILYFV